MPAPIEVRKVPLHNVSDASELAKLIDDGVMEADRIIAVIGKTEGNGGINDYTRIIADRAFREVLVEKGSRPLEEVTERLTAALCAESVLRLESASSTSRNAVRTVPR